jgi:exonuclease III
MLLLCAALVSLVGVSWQTPSERELSIVSWNVNGVRKFRNLPTEVSYLASQDVVLLQETFSREDNELLEIRGFYSHHQRALPRTGGHNVWGLSSYFKITTFTDGFWVKIFSPAEWLLISRMRTESGLGLLVCNVYMPVHTSGIAAHDIQLFRTTVEDLVTQYPGDAFLIAGDFNIDVYEEGRSTSPKIK